MITDVFKKHGGTPLDTPVFELKEILAGSELPWSIFVVQWEMSNHL